MKKGGFAGLRRRFRAAFENSFENSFGTEVGHVGTCLIWKNQDGRPQVLEMVCYQDGEKHDVSPEFFRASINFRPPEQSLTGFWGDCDEIDPLGPNAHIEITVLTEEAEALATWLPLWLEHREGVPVNVPPPPAGLEKIRRWEPKLQHVYLWSVDADKAYLTWKGGQPCPQA